VKLFVGACVWLVSAHLSERYGESLQGIIEMFCEYLGRMTKIGMTLEIEMGGSGSEEDGVDKRHRDASARYTQPEGVDYAYTELSKSSPRFTSAASFGNV
ncbi:class II fructose-bisphosphate aldolase, partial [Escherichia coli]|uniref:class II fructose-bisphosphate aldolase n=1 Tax=Escherichia coli TaxID=562 RepID=UPI0015C30959